MKYIFLLLPIFSFGQTSRIKDLTERKTLIESEEKYQMVYYSHNFLYKGNKTFYSYASYDMMYAEEFGLGITIDIVRRTKKKNNKKLQHKIDLLGNN